jgi:hypothetical protein
MVSAMSFSQTKATFSSFDAWRQNTTTKKMEFMKTIYETATSHMHTVGQHYD